MPRPRKWRKVCSRPRCTRFMPLEGIDEERTVAMTVDEYETIRLIDWEGFNQEQCAEQMEVARTTVQAIYQNARRKLADCIVNSRALVIDGGEYRICEHENSCCRHGCCYVQQGSYCPKEACEESVCPKESSAEYSARQADAGKQ